MRIRKTGGQPYSLMEANVALVTDKQDRTRKHLRLNSFKEDTLNRIGLIHKLMRGSKCLSRFPMGGSLRTHIWFALPFKRGLRSLFNFNQAMERT